MSLTSALEEALSGSQEAERHPAAVELARDIARTLEGTENLRDYASTARIYLETLQVLGLTPAKMGGKEGKPDATNLPSPLQAQRDAARARRAAAGNAPA